MYAASWQLPVELRSSLGMRVGNKSPLASISASSTEIKGIQTPHSPRLSPCPRSFGNYSRRLFKRQSKVLTANHLQRRQTQFWLFWLGLWLWQARTAWNTGHLRIDHHPGSSCGPKPVRLRPGKKCYHSCHTDLFRESKRFNTSAL